MIKVFLYIYKTYGRPKQLKWGYHISCEKNYISSPADTTKTRSEVFYFFEKKNTTEPIKAICRTFNMWCDEKKYFFLKKIKKETYLFLFDRRWVSSLVCRVLHSLLAPTRQARGIVSVKGGGWERIIW